MPSMSLEEHEHSYVPPHYSLYLNISKRDALRVVDENMSTVGGREVNQGDIIIWTRVNDSHVNVRRFTGLNGDNNHLPGLDPLRIPRRRIPEIAENIFILTEGGKDLMRLWSIGTGDILQDEILFFSGQAPRLSAALLDASNHHGPFDLFNRYIPFTG